MRLKSNSPNIVWSPIPGAQSVYLMTGQYPNLVREVLFHGTRGNGKSDCLIAAYLQHVGQGWGAHWNGIIFRKEFKTLSSLKKAARRIIPLVFPDAKMLDDGAEWRFATGERLLLRYIKKMAQYDDGYHGHDYQFIGWDELTTWSSPDLYEAMLSCLRSAYIPNSDQPRMPPLQVRAATNPYGIGKAWVRKRFIDGLAPGQVKYNDDGTPWLCHLFGTVFENPYIDKHYIDNNLKKITDPAKRAAWLLGDWDATDRGAFFGSIWEHDKVVIDPFTIPSSWRVDRSFDWGQSTPFGCLWIAQSDGTAAKLRDGTEFSPPAGSLIVVEEDYGTELDEHGEQTSQDAGLFLTATQTAIRLREHESRLTEPAGLLSNCKVLPGPADNQIWNGSKVSDRSSQTIADLMSKEGMKWERSDKSPGSRRSGAQAVLEMIAASVRGDCEQKQLYIFRGCRFLIRTLPALQRDENDLDAVQKCADDHLYDVLKYRALHKPRKFGVNF